MKKPTAAGWIAILTAVLALVGVVLAALADRTVTADEAQRIGAEVSKVLTAVSEQTADTPAEAPAE